jgi:hypothetical protein
VNTAAGNLYNPDLYEKLVTGSKLDSLILPCINQLDNKNLFLLVEYIFETVSF